MAKNHEISVYFLTNANLALSRTATTSKFKMVSKRRTLLSWKVANRYKFSISYAWTLEPLNPWTLEPFSGLLFSFGFENLMTSHAYTLGKRWHFVSMITTPRLIKFQSQNMGSCTPRLPSAITEPWLVPQSKVQYHFKIYASETLRDQYTGEQSTLFAVSQNGDLFIWTTACKEGLGLQ